ncbi:hypothetical protein RND81_04G224800 [Saponaria officinalis]|uniref:WAT1-related protein n=1 Tax=Saponaria officinalis TaxID=3572 RepID=A0AAW1LP19_SAPOF
MARNEILAILAMVIVQVGYAGMNISSKVAMNSGMPPLVLVAYRQFFATFALIPFAYFLERKTRPRITKKILFQIFLCSLFGASFNQIFYFIGLKSTTATISCALTNMLPAITFILAIPFGLEEVGIWTRGGQAKIGGTIVCIGGAMLLSFYHGQVINISQPQFHWKYSGHTLDNNVGSHITHHHNNLLGPLSILAANIFMAVYFILQAKMSENFQAPYTSSALLCFMASFQCGALAAFNNHNISDWSLTSRIRLVSSVYAGLIGSALTFCLMSWTIQRKGPLYVSVFSPLLLVIVALLSWFLQMEKLYVGTAIGSVLIVVGLYAVLWGKSKEMKNNKTHKMDSNCALDQECVNHDLEKQLQQVELKDVSKDQSKNQIDMH